MPSRIRDDDRANGRPVLVDFEKKGVYSSYTHAQSAQQDHETSTEHPSSQTVDQKTHDLRL